MIRFLPMLRAIPAVVLFCASSLLAQQPSPTPRDCIKALRAGSSPSADSVARAAARSNARQCLAKFDVATAPDSLLLDITQLAWEISDVTTAQRAMDRAITNKSLPAEQRGRRLAEAIRVYMGDSDTTGYGHGKALLPELDALNDSAVVHQSNGRFWIYTTYRVHAEPVATIKWGNEVLAFADRAAAKGLSTGLTSAHFSRVREELAMAYLKLGQRDMALATLKELLAQATEPMRKKQLEYVIKYASLVGAPAAIIETPYWLNAAPNTQRMDPKGSVTVVVASANWCVPCRASYPILEKLAEGYESQGVRFVMITRTFGRFEKQTGLQLSDELAINQKYFVQEHGIKFPIAVVDTHPGPGVEEDLAPIEKAYGVTGYPTFVVTGKDGRVTWNRMGVGESLESELTNAITNGLAAR